jgi:hypothetical protein
VQGARLWMTPSSARAGAMLETESAEQVWVELPLEWGDGEWSVADLHGLAAERVLPDTTAM